MFQVCDAESGARVAAHKDQNSTSRWSRSRACWMRLTTFLGEKKIYRDKILLSNDATNKHRSSTNALNFCHCCWMKI